MTGVLYFVYKGVILINLIQNVISLSKEQLHDLIALTNDIKGLQCTFCDKKIFRHQFLCKKMIEYCRKGIEGIIWLS